MNFDFNLSLISNTMYIVLILFFALIIGVLLQLIEPTTKKRKHPAIIISGIIEFGLLAVLFVQIFSFLLGQMSYEHFANTLLFDDGSILYFYLAFLVIRFTVITLFGLTEGEESITGGM